MKVKAGDTWYDSNEVPIMLEVNLGEQRTIGDMDRAIAPSGRYAQIPSQRFGWDNQDMRDWMRSMIYADESLSAVTQRMMRATDLEENEIEITNNPVNERSIAVYLLDLPSDAQTYHEEDLVHGEVPTNTMVITAKPNIASRLWEAVHYHVGKDESIFRSMVTAGCKKNIWYWVTVSENYQAQIIEDAEIEDLVNDGLSEESLNNGE